MFFFMENVFNIVRFVDELLWIVFWLLDLIDLYGGVVVFLFVGNKSYVRIK